MDTEKIKMLADKIRLNRALFTDHDEDQDLVRHNPVPDTIDETYRDLSEGVRGDGHNNTDLVNAIITKASELNLNGRNATVLLTLIYLLKIDSGRFQSQREIAEALGHKSISTIERHLKHLRDAGLVETEIVVDIYGSKTIYKFDNLKKKLKELGAKV